MEGGGGETSKVRYTVLGAQPRREWVWFVLGFGLMGVLAVIFEFVDVGHAQENAGHGRSEEISDVLGGNVTEFNEPDYMDLSVLSTGIPQCAINATKARSAIMYMMTHSGTTALITGLAEHEEVGNHSDSYDMEPMFKCHQNFTCEVERTHDIFKKAEKAGDVGVFKWNARTFKDHPEDWIDLLRKEETRIMFMHRPNLFKRSVGRYPFNFLDYDEHFGGLRDGEKNRCDSGSDFCTFKVDPEKVICEMKRGHFRAETLREAAEATAPSEGCYLEIVYDDYLRYPNQTMQMVAKFLGISPPSVAAGRQKSTSDNMCEVIENYADICAAFDECSLWHDMVNDERNDCLCKNFEYESLGGDDVNPLCHLNRLESERGYCVVDFEEYMLPWEPAKSK